MPVRRRRSRFATMAALLRREAGQMAPIIVFLLVGIVAMGVVAVAIGKATVMRSAAQTAADAAALAAARDIRSQLQEQVALTGTSSLGNINDARVQQAAQKYAGLNDGYLTRDIDREGA